MFSCSEDNCVIRRQEGSLDTVSQPERQRDIDMNKIYLLAILDCGGILFKIHCLEDEEEFLKLSPSAPFLGYI